MSTQGVATLSLNHIETVQLTATALTCAAASTAVSAAHTLAPNLQPAEGDADVQGEPYSVDGAGQALGLQFPSGQVGSSPPVGEEDVASPRMGWARRMGSPLRIPPRSRRAHALRALCAPR